MVNPENDLANRITAAKLLAHALTGDSWGIQDDLIEAQASLVEGWPLWWSAGQLLRRSLPDADRADLVAWLRRDIAAMLSQTQGRE